MHSKLIPGINLLSSDLEEAIKKRKAATATQKKKEIKKTFVCEVCSLILFLFFCELFFFFSFSLVFLSCSVNLTFFQEIIPGSRTFITDKKNWVDSFISAVIAHYDMMNVIFKILDKSEIQFKKLQEMVQDLPMDKAVKVWALEKEKREIVWLEKKKEQEK